MKKSTKIILRTASTIGAAAFGTCLLIDELLLNRKFIPSPEFSAKVTGCDMSHLEEATKKGAAALEEYGIERYYMLSERGEKLTAYLMKPEKESNVYAFCAHGYRSDAKGEFCKIAHYYLQKGINVFMPDHVASGESEGLHCTFGHNESADCLKWLAYMKDSFGSDIKVILHGVSMGAATVMMMSGDDSLPKNVMLTVSDCGYSTAVGEFTEKLKAMNLPAGLIIKGVNAVNKLTLGFDFYQIRPVDSVRNAKIPMLFIHGTGDTFIPHSMCQECYDACGSEHKEILYIEGADHAQSFPTDKETYSAKLDEMIDKYVLGVTV